MVKPEKAKRPTPSRKSNKAGMHDRSVQVLQLLAQQTSGEYIPALSDADILLGRGAPVQRRAANRRFRELAWEHKPTYDSTAKHAVKDKIARQILDTVKERGGRIVRPIESKEERLALKVPDNLPEAWIAISEDLAREKCKQALRDAVPPSPKREKLNPASPKKCRKRKCDPSSNGETSSQQKKGPSATKNQSSRAPIASRSDFEPSNTSSTTTEEATNPIPEVSLTALKSLPVGKDQSTLFDDDELSFRLKHPSLRKLDLSRMRHQHKQKPADAQQAATIKPAAVASGGAGPSANNVEHRGASLSAKCEKRVDEEEEDDDGQSTTPSLSCSSSSDKEGLDRKPRALKGKR